tara:strand:- start:173 stop:721 length:549 start_codon:yes stop_codon:yes gene_type:complete
MEAANLLPAEIETERLTLRKPRLEDAEEIFAAYSADPEVTTFLTWKPHDNPQQTRGYLGACLDEWSSGSGYPYVLTLKAERDAPIGMIHARMNDHGANMGYVLAKKFWNKGYMTEALICLSDLLLSEKSIFRVSSYCDVDNAASAFVMEKSGMLFEGVLKRYSPLTNNASEPRDCRMYAKTK